MGDVIDSNVCGCCQKELTQGYLVRDLASREVTEVLCQACCEVKLREGTVFACPSCHEVFPVDQYSPNLVYSEAVGSYLCEECGIAASGDQRRYRVVLATELVIAVQAVNPELAEARARERAVTLIRQGQYELVRRSVVEDL
jgi:hypothetical protein